MSNKGLLIDVRWCTGCHSCEMACQMSKGLPVDQFGIKVAEIGPWKYDGNKWMYLFVPSITEQCNLCEERVQLGQKPTCVKHCQADCMLFGDIDELAKELPHRPQAILLTAR